MKTLKDQLLANGFRPNTKQENWERFKYVAGECVVNNKPCSKGLRSKDEGMCNVCTRDEYMN